MKSSVSNVVLSMLTASAKKLNLPIDDLLNQLPKQAISQSTEATRLPLHVVDVIWQWFSTQSQIENIGLKLAAAQPLHSQLLLSYMAMSSGTFGDALKQAIKFQWLLSERPVMAMHDDGDECCIVFDFGVFSTQIHAAQAEYAFALIFAWLKDIIGNNFALTSVCFRHVRPQNISEHNALFNYKLDFESDVNRLVFPSLMLNLPLKFANAQVNSLVAGQANQMFTDVQLAAFVDQVNESVIQRLGKEDVNLDVIAQACDVTPRKLKTLLDMCQTNVSIIIDEQRQKRAVALLRQGSHSIAQISDACGFAEPSVFNRAFRRWFKLTPRQYQQQLISSER